MRPLEVLFLEFVSETREQQIPFPPSPATGVSRPQLKVPREEIQIAPLAVAQVRAGGELEQPDQRVSEPRERATRQVGRPVAAS